MKKTTIYCTLFFILAAIQTLQAQQKFGINTATPAAFFHIDGQKNSSTTNNNDIKDDVFVTTDGNLGLGVLSPKTKVDLRNSQNNDNILGLGTTSQTAIQAGSGALRYDNTNGIQYSNGTDWVTVTDNSVAKTVVAATKSTWSTTTAGDVYCYNGGYNANQSLIPNRAPCYIRQWTTKYDNAAGGGTFNATTGQFTATRASVFTATFTFALQAAAVSSLTENANQVEAIWRHIRGNTEINSVKCANTYASNSSGNVRLGSSCTANFDLEVGDIIRPELWIDVSAGTGATQSNANKRQFDISNNGAYNNLTIIEN